MTIDLFTQPTAEALRDQGIKAVTQGQDDWLERAHKALSSYPGTSANAEELREWVEAIAGAPRHPNIWGGLFIGAVRRGTLENSGTYVKGSRPEGRARRVPVYLLRRP
jgi:hypothetical protein